MTLALRPFPLGIDPDRFAAELAPAFGGDEGPAREILGQTIALLARDPRPDPWGSYVVQLDGPPIGVAAFKSAPAPSGEVEIAYMTFPAYEGRGHATATIAPLVEIAAGDGAWPIAHTLPEENASNRALRRNGFVNAGEVIDPEDGLVWRWESRVTAHQGLAGEQRRFGLRIFRDQPRDIIARRQHRVDRADALARAPDVAPGLGLGAVAGAEVHRADVAFGQVGRVEPGS